jgi:uncharacterized protein YqeY
VGLKERLKSDLTEAIRSSDKVVSGTIRMVLTAITTEEVAGKEARTLSEDEIINVLSREAKKRREAAEEFAKGNRPEKAAEEKAEGEQELAPKEPLTEEEVSQLRHVIVTPRRSTCLDKAAEFVTLGQSRDGGGWMMFNTSSGNDVIYDLPKKINSAMRKKTIPERFDHLFALTYKLHQYDFWLRDNEMWDDDGELQTAIKLLGRSWKNLLRKSNEELGIDEDFTRPGIEKLLMQFEELVDDAIQFPFKWD